MKKTKLLYSIVVLLLFSVQALGGVIGDYIWEKAKIPICGIFLAVIYVGGALCAMMIVYGGIKWLGGADDPGARKQAKDTVINACIGVLIILVTSGIVTYASGGELRGCEVLP